MLLAKQEKGQNRQRGRGSWPTDGPFRSPGGRLMTTSLALLTLQTCARTDKLPPPARKLKPRELAVLYDTLADKDFVEARRALRALAAAPRDSVPFLRTALKPVPLVEGRRIQRWIADLDSDEFAVRQRAAAESKNWARWLIRLCARRWRTSPPWKHAGGSSRCWRQRN